MAATRTKSPRKASGQSLAERVYGDLKAALKTTRFEPGERVREEAEVEAVRRRQDAAADAEAELQMAKQQGRDMVNEARAYRERVLGELARRREMARQQIEQLVHGRDRMLQAFERARLSAVDVMAELTPLAEPSEYVNLSPTTGPVPLMVPASQVNVAPPQAPNEVVGPIDMAIDDEPEVETEAVVETEPEIAPTAEVIDDVEDLAPTIESSGDDTGPLATVVSLFGNSDQAPIAVVTEAEEPESEPAPAPVAAPGSAPAGGGRDSVDDLFAKLRASSTDTVVERARAPRAETEVTTTVDSTEELSVFQASPEAPAADEVYDDTPFGRRDAELTPLIVASARKLKRVLADEQNDVLHALRSAKAAVSLLDLVPPEAEHVHQYAESIADDLRAAALAGASSTSDGGRKDLGKAVAKGNTLQPAVEALAASLVRPLRDRLERMVEAADGDAEELSMTVRAVYREWKTQRIDEHLGGPRGEVVVRRHREAVRACVAHHDEVALRGHGHHALGREHVAALADRADEEASLGGSVALGEALERVPRLVERRTNEVVHPRVHADPDPVAGALDVGDAGEQHPRLGDERAPRLDQQRRALAGLERPADEPGV